MQVTYTPASGKGKAIRFATVIAAKDSYTMRAQKRPSGVTCAFFEEGIEGYRMVTKDNIQAYNDLKKVCEDKLSS